MSNKKISQFTVVTATNGTTYIPVVQGTPLFDAIISASNFADSMTTYNDAYYIKVDGTNSNITQLIFNIATNAGALEAGELSWDANEGTLLLGMNGGEVIQSIGLEQYYRIKATENITNGQLCMFAGSEGNSGVLKASKATVGCEPQYIIGIATEDIASGQLGFVTWHGKISGLQTNGANYGETWVDGDILYQSAGVDGGLTKVEPTFGNKAKYAAVVNSHASNGHLFVRVTRSLSLNNINDVNVTETNQPIVRDASGHISSKATDLEIDSIQPSGESLHIKANAQLDGTVSTPLVVATDAIIDTIATDAIESLGGFTKTGADDTDVLLGGGGDKPIADFQLKSEKGVANGYASLDSNGLVPSTQLPSFVDDVIEVANYASLPVTGETGKIYVTLDTNKTYRWSGSAYVYITSGAVDSVAGKTGVVVLDKNDVGLSNVDNTSDLNKPISTATQTALNAKMDDTQLVTTITNSTTEVASTSAITSALALKANLAGGNTISGENVFTNPPSVTDDLSATSNELASVNKVASMITGTQPASNLALHPEETYLTGVTAGGGTVKDNELLLVKTEKILTEYPSNLMLFDEDGGFKITSDKVETAYSMDNTVKALSQATAGNRFFIKGNIAPIEKRGLRVVRGITADMSLTLSVAISKLISTNWSLTTKINGDNLSTTASDIYLYSDSTRISILSTGVSLYSNTNVVSACSYAFKSGLNYVISFYHIGTKNYLYINGELQTLTTDADYAINIDRILVKYNTNPFYGVISHVGVVDGVMSAAASQALALSLGTSNEGQVIGNQVWAPSNCTLERDSAGNQIAEMQDAIEGSELCTFGTFDDATNWVLATGHTISGGTFNVASTTTSSSYRTGVSSIVSQKWYKIYIEVPSYTSGGVRLSLGYTGESPTSYITTTGTYWLKAGSVATTVLYITPLANTTMQIDNLSIKTVGWSDATNMYNGLIAQGTSASDALKAVAWWSHYDNLASNGAIYGKLYNWYAVSLLSKNAPSGWRVPSENDVLQNESYLGGRSVAWTKNKAIYGGVTATNESGMSFLIGGIRMNDGVFSTGVAFLWTSTQFDATQAYRRYIDADTTYIGLYQDKRRGGYIRLIRNEPAGDYNKTYETGVFETNISSTAKQTAISFGRVVRTIRIESANTLTNVEVKLHNSAGTAIATLITGKGVTANVPKTFSVFYDSDSLLQDGQLRITASGNGVGGMNVIYSTEKSI